jgi:hypothetical protein
VKAGHFVAAFVFGHEMSKSPAFAGDMQSDF